MCSHETRGSKKWMVYHGLPMNHLGRLGVRKWINPRQRHPSTLHNDISGKASTLKTSVMSLAGAAIPASASTLLGTNSSVVFLRANSASFGNELLCWTWPIHVKLCRDLSLPSTLYDRLGSTLQPQSCQINPSNSVSLIKIFNHK